MTGPPSSRPKAATTTRSRVMSSIRSSGNKSTEWRMRAGLVRSGIRGWKVNPTDIQGRPDFAFPSERLVIFVDGCFWHGCSRCFRAPQSNKEYWDAKISYNSARDMKINRQLEEAGWRVLRFWEHELKENLGQVLITVNRHLTEG